MTIQLLLHKKQERQTDYLEDLMNEIKGKGKA